MTRKKRPASPKAAALTFAGYLDARRFCEAERCLAADCIYEPSASARILGAAEIIKSYRDNDAAGAELLDDLRYTSRVESSDSETVTIEFTDYLRVGDRVHTFISRQHFTVRDGVILRIVGEESPLARQALDAFLESCGVRRHSPTAQ